jgi:hypothetical protein
VTPDPPMNSDMWRSLCDDISPEATPHDLEAALGEPEVALGEDERAALWLYVWSRSRRPGRTAARLSGDARSNTSPAMRVRIPPRR